MIIAPLWPGQLWFLILLHMMIDFPLLLPMPLNLYLPWSPEYIHLLATEMQLFSTKLSGRQGLQKDFTHLLQSTSLQHLSHQHKHVMGNLLKSGMVFERHGRQIPTSIFESIIRMLHLGVLSGGIGHHAILILFMLYLNITCPVCVWLLIIQH